MCPRPSFLRDEYLQLIVRISSKLSDLFSRKNMSWSESPTQFYWRSIENISPEYVSKLDMASLTTLVVENLFAEMRDGNDMPLVLQFAHRLSSTLREHLKRNAKCSFNYFTSSSAFYSKQLGFLPFSTIPTMSKPEKDSKVTRQQLAEMQKWREEFGQSVRQVTVRNKIGKYVIQPKYITDQLLLHEAFWATPCRFW